MARSIGVLKVRSLGYALAQPSHAGNKMPRFFLSNPTSHRQMYRTVEYAGWQATVIDRINVFPRVSFGVAMGHRIVISGC